MGPSKWSFLVPIKQKTLFHHPITTLIESLDNAPSRGLGYQTSYIQYCDQPDMSSCDLTPPLTPGVLPPRHRAPAPARSWPRPQAGDLDAPPGHRLQERNAPTDAEHLQSCGGVCQVQGTLLATCARREETFDATSVKTKVVFVTAQVIILLLLVLLILLLSFHY